MPLYSNKRGEPQRETSFSVAIIRDGEETFGTESRTAIHPLAVWGLPHVTDSILLLSVRCDS
jgi:hypothetical protein